MSLKVTIHQLQAQLPDLLDRAAESGEEEYITRRDGQDYAVLVSASEGQRRTREPYSHVPSLSGREQERRRQEIGRRLDAMGGHFRLAPEKQARAEDLLARKERLTSAERRELDALLRECDATMLRRAKALDHES